MNRFFVFCIMVFSILSLSAQDVMQYQVFLLKGNVFKVVRREQLPVKELDVLNKKDVLSLSQGSEIKLVQMRDSVVVTLKGQCAGSIMSLIAEQRGSEQSMTAKYYSFVSRTLSGRGEGHHNRSTVVFREDEDSLLQRNSDRYFPLSLGYSYRQYAAPISGYSSERPLVLKPLWFVPVLQKAKKKHGK